MKEVETEREKEIGVQNDRVGKREREVLKWEIERERKGDILICINRAGEIKRDGVKQIYKVGKR